MNALTPIAQGSQNLPIDRSAYTTGQTYYMQVFVATDDSATTFPRKLVLADGTSPSVLANDAFAAAVSISGTLPKSASGTTVGATLESEKSIYDNKTRSVWYKYTSNVTPATVRPKRSAESRPVIIHEFS